MKEFELKYGCNPNQKPAKIFMADGSDLPIEILSGRPGYINFLDAFNSWQLVRELKAATGLPAVTSFKHVSPTGAAVGLPLPEKLKKACFVDDIEGLDDSPLACAYARARGTDRMCSFGDWVAMSDVCDATTAKMLKREVSDGVIAPGYTDEALEILKTKRKGNYNIVRIDPDYVPAEQEHKTVFGVTFEQGRNNFTIDRALLSNLGKQGPARERRDRPDHIAHHPEIYAVQLRVLRLRRTGHRRGRGAAVPHPLHAACGLQGGYLVPAPERQGAFAALPPRPRQTGPRQRDRRLHQPQRGGRDRRRQLAEVFHRAARALYG